MAKETAGGLIGRRAYQRRRRKGSFGREASPRRLLRRERRRMGDERSIERDKAHPVDDALRQEKPIERVARLRLGLDVFERVRGYDRDDRQFHILDQLWEAFERGPGVELSKTSLYCDFPQSRDADEEVRLFSR
jgi:hypothetical protein